MTSDQAIGAIGRLILPVRGPDQPGEVVLTVGGLRESYFADSPEPIERGQTVLVIAVGPHRHVTVVPWTEVPMPG